MPLDPQVVALYEEKNRRMELNQDNSKIASHIPSVIQARKDADIEFNDMVEIIPIFKTEDILIPCPVSPLPIRIYTPGNENNYPVMLYFHGGGFIMHNIASHDSLCRKLSISSNCIVVSVEYRLAPEYPYPAAVEDSYTALEWVARNAHTFKGDPHRLVVAGDSAGATISVALSLLSRDRNGPPISVQLLFYGLFGSISDDESQSMKSFGNGEYVLPRAIKEWCMEQYNPDDSKSPRINLADLSTYWQDPYLYPGKAADISGLPKTMIVTAEYDPLRDDGETFAKRLEEQSNEVTTVQMQGMMHGFLLYWHRLTRVELFLEEIGTWIRTMLNKL